MRIIEVSNARSLGGVESHVWNISRRLARRFDVEIFTPNPNVKKTKTEVTSGVTITEFPALAPSNFYFFSREMYRSLVHAKGAIVHAHGCQGFSTFASALAKKKNRLPLVITPHYSYSNVPLLFNLYNETVNRFVFSQSDSIVCVSPTEIAALGRVGDFCNKAIYIPNGIDFDVIDRYIARYERPKSPMTVLFIGRLEKNKGVHNIIEAFSKKRRDASLLIIGSGTYRNELARMVEQLGVRHEVKFLGEVSTDRLMSVYAQSHIFALPSKYESHSMALTEAMGFGLAPIATDVGGNPFLISEGCGFIVSYPIEEEELSSALNKLLENYELVQEIGKRARAKAKSHFDITKSLKRLEQTYIDLTA